MTFTLVLGKPGVKQNCISHINDRYTGTKINGDSWRYVANSDISVHIHSLAIFQDFECVHGFEKSRGHAVKHGKCISVPQGEHSRMCTKNLDLIMQKDSQVVQIIILDPKVFR